jgi:hypothetical protein
MSGSKDTTYNYVNLISTLQRIKQTNNRIESE